MSVYNYNNLITLLASRITENGNREITGPVLNAMLLDIIDSSTLKHRVADSAALAALTDKYAGMRVLTTNDDKTYILASDLTTWKEVTYNGYSQAVIDAALATKQDKEAGKGLSTNDFTNALKSKLNAIEAEATKNETDAYLVDRANHTGEQATSTITGLDALLEGILDDVVALENGVNVTYKNIVIVTDATYQITDRDHTIISVSDGSLRDVILPDATLNNGRIVCVKKGDDTGIASTILPYDYDQSNSTSSDFQLIEGEWEYQLTETGHSVWLQAKSGRWYIIASYLPVVPSTLVTTSDIESPLGGYHYMAASTSADTVGDVRTSSTYGGGVSVFKIEKCTVASGTKGGGTWVSMQTFQL